MSQYDLNKLLDIYTDDNFSEEIKYEDYKDFLENFVNINKPDFIVLLNLKAKDKIIFSKNYNLKFDAKKEPSINEIVKAVDPDQLAKITEVDMRCMQFVEENEMALHSTTFKLRFTASLVEGHPRTFIRTISFIPRKYLDSYHIILFISITDVTNLVGLQKEPSIDIRCLCEKEDGLSEKIESFKNKLNNILAPSIQLTQREREVLSLIAEGFTSEEISKKLFISVTTVQTHRQNLIKKFDVKNTAALVKFM